MKRPLVKLAGDASAPTTEDLGHLNYKHPPAHQLKRHKSHQSPYSSHPIALSPIRRFIADVNREINDIGEQLSQVYHFRDQLVRNMNNDPPFADLQQSGSRKDFLMAIFVKGLSQRSLATEFDKWEQATYGSSKIELWAVSSLPKPNRSLGHLAEYLELKRNHFRDIRVTRHAIQHGIKLLLCERMLHGTGISAIFIFKHTRLRSIKFEELGGLSDAMKDADRIMELANQKADWIDQCQKDYDGK